MAGLPPGCVWSGEQLQQKFSDYQNKTLPPVHAEQENCMCWIADWCLDDLPAVAPDGREMYDVFNLALNQGIPKVSEDRGTGAVFEEKILVFADSYGFAKGIIDNAPRGRVGNVHYVTKPPGSITEKELPELLNEKWSLCIYAYGVDPPKSSALDDLHSWQKDCTELILRIAKHLLRKPDAIQKIAVLTCDTFSDDPETHQEMGASCITNCTLFGFTNTARMEVDMPWHYIDTEWSLTEENMCKLADEVFRLQIFGHNSVRILNSGRYVLRQIPAFKYEEAGFDFLMPEEGVIAISGGNGALGLVFGQWFLDTTEKQMKRFPEKKYKFTIKFCSRSMKISDANMYLWDSIQKKAEQLGVTCEQAKCDVGNPDSCDAFVKENVEVLKGFVHSAGVLADMMLINQTWEKYETVWEGKSRAALYLHTSFEKFKPPLEFYWMFSSVSCYGNMGQSNYSASNAFLDGLARHRRALGLPAVTMQWGAWGEVGMATTLDDASKRRMANSPYPYFKTVEGLAGLEAGLRTGCPLFATFKVNPQICIGMVQGDNDVVMHNYQRNWISESWPLPPCIDGNIMYNLYRHCFLEPKVQGPRLVYDKFVASKLEG